MQFIAVPSVLSALFCAGLALFVLSRNPKSFVHRAFALGMFSLSLMEIGNALGLLASSASLQAWWKKVSFTGEALLPGSWLLFSLSFARSNYKELLSKWKGLVFLLFLFPVFLVSFSWSYLLIVPGELYEVPARFLPLGRAGYFLELFFLLSLILILMNLEGTFRASSGIKRWQIKFMILGLGSGFAFLLYSTSQNLLFSSVNFEMTPINSAAILVADCLILFSLGRRSLLEVDLYISKHFLFNSLTVLVVGIYLIAVGSIAKIISLFGGGQGVPLGALVVFVALLGIMVVLLSDQLRQEAKRFISRNFYRAHYDYRKEWTEFTERTSSILEMKDMCSAVARMVSETFGVPSVTIWLFDEIGNELSPGGSTALSQTQMQTVRLTEMGGEVFLNYLRGKRASVDFGKPSDGKARKIKEENPEFFEPSQVRICVPLLAGRHLLGIMTLGKRVTDEPFTTEDQDLLNTLAAQAASSLLNLSLSQKLLKAKEAEAFQTLSAFFIHDLKNLASMLSLTMQNLPANYDNPAFRKDTLRVISESVSKMDAMCSRLSLLTKKLDLQQTETDLNKLVISTLASLNGCIQVSLVQDLHPVPKISLDSDQIQKVLLNLVLNANEAVDNQGEIRVRTDQTDGWAVLSVTDNGCGMSKEFIARSLFQPFQTTKSQGLGIGLFHSKKIVEAHHGRIEVESEAGRGSTFRVLLPVLSVKC
jgi:putative PEP-CTERM system histidine kinase